MSAKCWLFLLNRRRGENRLSVCNLREHAAHKTAKSPAHTLEGFVFDHEMDEFLREATASERQLLFGDQTPPKGKGGRGRGRGGSRGGQHFRKPTSA